MKSLITICARGGSKGVPNKNSRELRGKPLIAYTIETAQKWGKAEAIVVSSDSEEIRNIARQYGVETPFIRPSELAQDDSPKLPVIRHALKESEAYFQKKFEYIIDLDPTAPLRTIQNIEDAVKRMTTKKPSTVFSVVPAHKNPYFNMVEIQNGKVVICKKLNSKVHRRQDAPPVYDMNASIYVYQRDFLLDESTLSPLAENSEILIMNPISAFDVDREVDFKFLEFVLKEKVFEFK